MQRTCNTCKLGRLLSVERTSVLFFVNVRQGHFLSVGQLMISVGTTPILDGTVYDKDRYHNKKVTKESYLSFKNKNLYICLKYLFIVILSFSQFLLQN
jgi:hypothetical protein